MQLGLTYDRSWKCSAAWCELLKEFNRTVATVTLKEAAYSLDTSGSQLSHALAERDRHYVRAQWVPYLLMASPDDRPVEILASLRGLTVTPRQDLSPEQKLDRLTRALGELLGKDLRQAIYDRAWK